MKRILLLIISCGLVASALAQDAGRSSFDRYNFNVGLGEGIGRGAVSSYVGNSFQTTVGGGMNFSRLFGVDAEYMYYDLNFRPSVKINQALPGQSGHMQSFSLNGIVNAPYHFKRLGVYGIFGVAFYDRTVKLAHSQFLANETPVQPAWQWWDLSWINYTSNANGTIYDPNPPYGVTMSSNSKIAGGYNYGGGLTYRLNSLHHAKIYAEWRYRKAYTSDVQTIVWPVTVGLRW
ncbi:MAG: outer membrane beta-barrel protein [Terriglobales bacterium]